MCSSNTTTRVRRCPPARARRRPRPRPGADRATRQWARHQDWRPDRSELGGCENRSPPKGVAAQPAHPALRRAWPLLTSGSRRSHQLDDEDRRSVRRRRAPRQVGWPRVPVRPQRASRGARPPGGGGQIRIRGSSRRDGRSAGEGSGFDATLRDVQGARDPLRVPRREASPTAWGHHRRRRRRPGRRRNTEPRSLR